MRAGVGRAAPTETARAVTEAVGHAAVTRETAGARSGARGGTGDEKAVACAGDARGGAGRDAAGAPGAGHVALGRRRANLSAAFTGPIARGLALVAIVIGGLMFAFGEGGSKSALAGIIFGLGMALGAANFITWMF